MAVEAVFPETRRLSHASYKYELLAKVPEPRWLELAQAVPGQACLLGVLPPAPPSSLWEVLPDTPHSWDRAARGAGPAWFIDAEWKFAKIEATGPAVADQQMAASLFSGAR